MKTPMEFPLTDLRLAQRLEGTEGEANMAFVEARALIQPESGAAHTRIGGMAVMYDGPESPLTQTFGLGVFDTPEVSDFDEVEAFFRARGAPVSHETSPLAAPETFVQLVARGYRPIEFSTVLVRPTSSIPATDQTVKVREVEAADAGVWSRVSGEGWASESPELADFIEGIGRIVTRASGVHCFLAELDGVPIAAGSLSLSADTALLAGASTVPSARRRGAQLALLAARLDFAAVHGVQLAMMVAHPGSASQRNAERQGFRTAYTRIKWQLPALAGGAP